MSSFLYRLFSSWSLGIISAHWVGCTGVYVLWNTLREMQRKWKEVDLLIGEGLRSGGLGFLQSPESKKACNRDLRIPFSDILEWLWFIFQKPHSWNLGMETERRKDGRTVKCHSRAPGSLWAERGTPARRTWGALPVLRTEKCRAWPRQRSVAAHLRTSSRIQKKSLVCTPEVLQGSENSSGKTF